MKKIRISVTKLSIMLYIAGVCSSMGTAFASTRTVCDLDGNHDQTGEKLIIDVSRQIVAIRVHTEDEGFKYEVYRIVGRYSKGTIIQALHKEIFIDSILEVNFQQGTLGNQGASGTIRNGSPRKSTDGDGRLGVGGKSSISEFGNCIVGAGI